MPVFYDFANNNLSQFAALVDGRIVEVYRDGSAIAAQIWQADGTADGASISIGTVPDGNQLSYFQYDVTAAMDGGFAVAWVAYSPDAQDTEDGEQADVCLNIYSSVGVVQTSDVLVNSHTAQDQDQPSLTQLADGSFLVAWANDAAEAPDDPEGVHGRLFTAAGAAVGDQFGMHPDVAGFQVAPQVTALSFGGAVMTYIDEGATINDDFAPDIWVNTVYAMAMPLQHQ